MERVRERKLREGMLERGLDGECERQCSECKREEEGRIDGHCPSSAIWLIFCLPVNCARKIWGQSMKPFQCRYHFTISLSRVSLGRPVVLFGLCCIQTGRQWT